MRKPTSHYRMDKQTKRLLMSMTGERKSLFSKETIAADITPRLDFQFREKKKKGGEDVSEG
jgi:hypothetical protein